MPDWYPGLRAKALSDYEVQGLLFAFALSPVRGLEQKRAQAAK